MDAQIQIFNEDCIQGMADRIANDSIHLTVTSIPFEELFTYSGKLQDVGNNGSTVDIRAGRFALNMRFVVEQLFRVTAPGCNVCIHIQQLLAYKNQHGFMGRRDFRGAMIDVFGAGGFHFTGEFAIQKNPQAMANRLNLHSLQFKTGYGRCGQNLAPCPNDYVLIFQKPGNPEHPVRPLIHKANPNGWVTTDEWVRDAHGIWTDILEIDILDGARSSALKESDQEKHVCLARDTLVLTRKGYIPIHDVNVGEMVLTHRGRWKPIMAKTCRGIKSTIHVHAQGVPFLLTTPDHLLYARRGIGRGRWATSAGGVTQQRQRAKSNSPEWMRSDATKGSYLCLPLPPIEESPYTIHEWWIVGRWLGDGHFDSRNRVHISCGNHEVDELVELLRERAGAVTQRRTGHQIAIYDKGGRLRSLLNRCGRGAAGKKLPAEAIALNKEKAEALLSGYLSADGHYVARYKRWVASSVSRSLLLGMAMVAQRARGIVVSVYGGRKAGTAEIEGRTVNTKNDWVMSIPPKNLSGMFLDNAAWKKVRKIDDSGEIEVWDIQVEDDESFVAEGCVVHNCPLQLEVVRRLVRLYTNPIELQPNVTVLDPFMGIGSTAWICLGGSSPVTKKRIEDLRNVIGFELKESYHRQAVKNADTAIKQAFQVEQDKRPLLASMN